MASEFLAGIFSEIDPGIIGFVVMLVIGLLAKSNAAKHAKGKGVEMDEAGEFSDLDEDPEIRELKKMLGKLSDKVKPLRKSSIPQEVQFPDVERVKRRTVPEEVVKPACAQTPAVQPETASKPSFAPKTHHSAPTVKKVEAHTHKSHHAHQTPLQTGESSAPLFSSQEELRRAVIYSEIMQPKFKEE